MACRTNRCGCKTCGLSSCGGGCSNYAEVSCGPKVVIQSYFVKGGKYRQVKFANGCCERIAKSWVPQTYNYISGNGPVPRSKCFGGDINNTDSECMDTLNYMFNNGRN